jgi:hypothetical protein
MRLLAAAHVNGVHLEQQASDDEKHDEFTDRKSDAG